MSRPRLVVFSDLDGTLLDHETYDWSPAKPALAELKKHGIPLVLNSSKTSAEIRSLRQALGNRHPYIVENGAALIIPAGYFGDQSPSDQEEVVEFGTPRSELLEVLAQLREEGHSFTGFSDLSDRELAEETGLGEEDAALAKQRIATEPVIFHGSQIDMAGFRQKLERRGLKLVKSGRFSHVMGDFDKSRPMATLMERYRAFYDKEEVISIALGDGPNDRSMLEEADIAVVIRAARPEPLVLPETHSVMYSDRKGPEGWKQCVMTILAGKGY